MSNENAHLLSFAYPLFTPFYMLFFIHSPSLPFLGVVHRGGLKTTFPPRGSEDFSAAGSGSVLGPRAWHGNLQTSEKTLESIVNHSKSNPKRGGKFKCLSVFSQGYYQ